MTEFWVSLLAIVVGGFLLALVTRRVQKGKVKRQAERVLRNAERNVYRVQHNLHETEPLVTLYDAVTGAVVPASEYLLHLNGEMALEILTDYERPFRAVVVNAVGAYHRCTFIPMEENP